MKIIAIRSYLKHVRLKKPYTIAYNTYYDVSLAFLEVELANGIIGYGSGSPSEEVVGETTQQTSINLQTDFVQAFVGRDIRQFNELIYETTIRFKQFPGTISAIDIALHDAFGKYIQLPIAQFYGQKIKSLPTSITIGICDVQETLAQALEYKKMGFRILKVKTGNIPEVDLERIIKLIEIFSDYFIIRVDANQGYTYDELTWFMKSTNAYKIELIEQPLKVGLENELLKLNHADRKILAADESLKNVQSAISLATKEPPFGIFNIKLMKCGGIIGAREIATIAQASSIDLFWGCNDESIISITAALHVAYSCQNTKYLDLDGSFDLAEDIVTGGFEIIDGYMHINNNPGFGIDII
jgi:L-alanine-DL-glutamate epimerase-like enolase superfamily enzyme